MKHFFIFLFLFFAGHLFAQDDHFYGGCGDEMSSKIYCDGHYRYIAGTTTSFYNARGYLIKTDTSGNVIWSKGFPDFGDVMSIISIAPNRLMLLYYNRNTNNSGLLTTDTSGNTIRFSYFDPGFAVYTLKNYFDKVVVAGSDFINFAENQPAFLAVLDTASNWLYGKYYTFSNFAADNNITAIIVNPDSSIECLQEGLNLLGFFKVNSALIPGILKNVNIPNEQSYSIFHTQNSGYLVAGWILDNNLVLVRADASENVLWQKEYRSVGDSLISTQPFACLSLDGTKITFGTFLGRFHSNNPNFRETYTVLNLDTSGTPLFFKDYGDTAYEYFNYGFSNAAPSICTEGNKIVLFGSTTSNSTVNSYISPNIQQDFQVVTLDASFNSSLTTRNLTASVSTNLNVPMITYTISGFPLNMNMIAMSVNANNVGSTVNNASECLQLSVPEKNKDFFSVSPNPNSGEFTIQFNEINSNPVDIKIYSSIGELIMEKHHLSSEEITIDLNNENSGIYFVELISGNKINYQKVEIVR